MNHARWGSPGERPIDEAEKGCDVLKPILSLAAAAAIIAAVSAPVQAQKPEDGEGASASGPHMIGPIDAEVTIDIFYSPICSHCARTLNETTPQLIARAQSGEYRIRFNEMIAADGAFRHDQVTTGTLEIVALNCVDEARYLPLAQSFTARITDINESSEPSAVILQIAAEHGASGREFDACLADPAMLALAQARRDRFTEAGMRGVPSAIVLPSSIADCAYGPAARPAFFADAAAWERFLSEQTLGANFGPATVDEAVSRVDDWEEYAARMGLDASCAAYHSE